MRFPPSGIASRSIDGQVENNLAELDGIGYDGGEVSSIRVTRLTSARITLRISSSVSRKISAESMTVKVGPCRRLNVSSCLGEVARSLHRVQDGVDVRVGFGGKLIAKELGVAADDSQDVVEVVSDPAGEASTASIFWASRICSQLLPAGDVLDDAIDKRVPAEWLKLMWAYTNISVASDEPPLENGVSDPSPIVAGSTRASKSSGWTMSATLMVVSCSPV